MGSPKELLDWKGRPLLVQLAENVQAVGLSCLVVANGQHPLPLEKLTAMGVRVTPDAVASRGPVSGFCTAMRRESAEAFLVLSCDLPFAEPEQLKLLLGNRDELKHWDAVIPEQRGRLQPLFALYHRRTQPLWETAFQSGQYRLMEVLKKLRIRTLPDSLLDQWATYNMNTPDDYRIALRERERRDALSPSND
ncbi:MAG: molybdenum cofactor guanylyltransferase [Brevibacillus sp.]|nr:molybdenum cofactor guanylyltransferase [Brevibacillus sp.]